jgi:recombination protein RecT
MANNNIIQRASSELKPEKKQQASINTMMNAILDGENMRKRFDELLGKRAPQFISSIVSLVNANDKLQKAFREAPMTIIQSALKAATFDLPIEPSLGYAHIIPFNNSYKDENGEKRWRTEATFVIGYKGLEQLCLRTGAYSRIPDAVDVREGELIEYNRLTGDAEFKWVEDEDEREKLPVIGYAGYFRLKNGAEKTIYMTVKQIEAHEKKNRKGEYMTKNWREDFDSMARKTIIRRLASKYGLMSIEYKNGDPETLAAATAVMNGEYADEVMQSVDAPIEYVDVDVETGEVKTDA